MRHRERSAAALIILLFSLILSAQSVYDQPNTTRDNVGTKLKAATVISGSVFDISLDDPTQWNPYQQIIEKTARSIMTFDSFVSFERTPRFPHPMDLILSIFIGAAYPGDAAPYLYADIVLFQNGKVLFDKRYSVMCGDCQPNEIPLNTADDLFLRLISLIRNDALLYETARAVLGAKTIPEPLPLQDPFRIIAAPDLKPLIFPVFMTLNLRTLFGTTWVDIYDNKNDLSAAGVGTILEEKVTVSFGDPESGWYITPDIGFFYRRLITKDFAFDTSDANRTVDGFVPGITRNDDTGQYLKIFSLSYDSQFYSMYFGGHGGYQLVAGTSKFQFTLHPAAYINLLELRWTKFTMGLDRRSTTVRPHFFGSLGATLEAGFFLPTIRTGLRIGTDISYFMKFKLPTDLTFKRVEYKEIELEPGQYVDLYLPQEFNVQESSIFSVLGYVDIYFVF